MIGRSVARPLAPVSLLTGFLGSGKTTVLNHLLRQAGLERTAVVVNEFGEIGIDHELIESSSEDMVLLRSGCLCCTIRGDLVDTLQRLALRRNAGEIDFDRVIVETTGLADPAPILHTLMQDGMLIAAYRLDGVITTVDAANGNTTLDCNIESVKQAAVADRIVLTKTDLASSDRSTDLFERLCRLNPAAPITVARDGKLDPARVLNAGLYDPTTKSLNVQRWLQAEASAGDRRRHDHHHDVNRHDAHIKAICLTFDTPLDGSAFDTWLGVLLTLKGRDLLRIKGIVNVAGLDGPIVIHGVQHVFHPPVRLKRWPSDDRRTRIVFIARNIDDAALRDTLAMFWPQAATPSMAAS